jgi:predicted transglutaminase-like protease
MTVTLLWKCNELIVTQQELLRYYSNVTKDLTCHNIDIFRKLAVTLNCILK